MAINLIGKQSFCQCTIISDCWMLLAARLVKLSLGGLSPLCLFFPYRSTCAVIIIDFPIRTCFFLHELALKSTRFLCKMVLLLWKHTHVTRMQKKMSKDELFRLSLELSCWLHFCLRASFPKRFLKLCEEMGCVTLSCDLK